jgi:hypothetical protein
MKFINIKTHAFLDYFMGLFLVVAPFIFHLNRQSPEGLLFYVLGATLLIYSMLTDYEFSLLKIIPMKVHLLLDVLSGIFLAASPWIFNFADRIYIPHLILGILEIGAGLMTSTTPKSRI